MERETISFETLIEKMKANTAISESMEEMRIGDAGATQFAQELAANTSLTEIDLSGCHLSDAGAIALANALESEECLTYLSLASNDIGDAGARALAQALQSNTSLTFMDLSLAATT